MTDRQESLDDPVPANAILVCELGAVPEPMIYL
jgi:hypothetical protein